VSAEDRAAFVQEVNNELANIDADIDDIRSRAAMAGEASRARVQPLVRDVAMRRAQLERSRKSLETVTGGDWVRARDEAQLLIDDTKARVRLARDAI
jgi:hypothetical protein